MAATVLATDVVRGAAGEARALSASVIGQEHVLLAIGGVPTCVGAGLLGRLGIDAASARGRLLSFLSLLPPKPTRWATDPKPTVRLERAIREADEEARAGGRPTTTGDLILGILRAKQGVGYVLLASEGIVLGRARDELAGLLPGDPELEATSAASLEDVLAAA